MRILSGILVLLLFPALALARGESSGGMERLRVAGFYGYGSLPAGDVNNYINGVSASPKWGNLTNAWSYGGYLGYMLNHRFELILGYEQQWATNPVTTGGVTNAGLNLYMNSGWGGLNYWFYEHPVFRLAIGAKAGYPTYAHATLISGPYTQYDSAFSPIYQATATGSVMLGKHFSIDLEGGYQYALLGALSQGGGTTGNLKQPNGSNVNLDFSGWRIKGGLSFYF